MGFSTIFCDCLIGYINSGRTTTSFEANENRPANGVANYNVFRSDTQSCATSCINDGGCAAWSYDSSSGWCYLKHGVPSQLSSSGVYSGKNLNKLCFFF